MFLSRQGWIKIHPRVLKELTEAIAEPLAIIFEHMEIKWGPKWLEEDKYSACL